jgi:hypothetical protein
MTQEKKAITMPIESKTIVRDRLLRQNTVQTLELRQSKKTGGDCADEITPPRFVICSARL